MGLGRDVLLEVLRTEGVRHVFGNPGSTELPLIDALADADDLHYVLGAAGGDRRRHGRRLRAGHRATGLPQPPHVGRPRQRHRQPHQRPVQPHAAGGHGRPAGLPPHRHRPAAVRPARRAGRRHGEVGPRGAHARRARHGAAAGVPRRRPPAGRAGVRLAADGPARPGRRRRRRRRRRCASRAWPVASRSWPTSSPGRRSGSVAIVVGDAVAAAGAVPSAVALAEALGAPVYGAPLHGRGVFPPPTRCGRACSRPRPPAIGAGARRPTSACC